MHNEMKQMVVSHQNMRDLFSHSHMHTCIHTCLHTYACVHANGTFGAQAEAFEHSDAYCPAKKPNSMSESQHVSSPSALEHASLSKNSSEWMNRIWSV